jgi:hypothetical protein
VAPGVTRVRLNPVRGDALLATGASQWEIGSLMSREPPNGGDRLLSAVNLSPPFGGSEDFFVALTPTGSRQWPEDRHSFGVNFAAVEGSRAGTNDFRPWGFLNLFPRTWNIDLDRVCDPCDNYDITIFIAVRSPDEFACPNDRLSSTRRAAIRSPST